jgi:hypothetical protein
MGTFGEKGEKGKMALFPPWAPRYRTPPGLPNRFDLAVQGDPRFNSVNYGLLG